MLVRIVVVHLGIRLLLYYSAMVIRASPLANRERQREREEEEERERAVAWFGIQDQH